MRAPTGYVPGLGRGAAGFTTRSDVGPSKIALPTEADAGPAAPPGPPAKPGAKPGAKEEPEAEDDSKFDEFMGGDGALLAGTTGEYDRDDKEADDVWESVDAFMDGRRRDRREARLKDEIEKYRAENPKITEQFADLKRKLGGVSESEWEAIPDIGDRTIKNKARRFESFVPVPDTLLAAAAAEKQSSTMQSGPETSGYATTDLTAVGEGRETVIRLNLDRMADSVTGQTVVDPKGYLTDMKSIKISSDAEISDIKKARLLLKSVTSTNPRHAPGWIAAARLEELAGKATQARLLLAKGCENCPTNDDVWLENARVQSNSDNAKAVLARGVAAIPNSIKLWLQAARLETEQGAKARVLRRALERIPTSVRLWKAAVELASEDDARILLARAVECCPQHVELWLAFARLERVENARAILNKAREKVPTDASIWFTAAKLEEAHGNLTRVSKIIERAVKSLTSFSVIVDRDVWLKEAEAAERGTPPMIVTCQAIVSAVVGLGVDNEDRKRTWMADADETLRRGSVHTARAILVHARSVFPGKKSIWRREAQLEKAHGTPESLDAVLQQAVRYCPRAEVLWLMAAKEKWVSGNVPAARQVLLLAFEANPDSEDIWLAAFKLEFENQEPERARIILSKARGEGEARIPASSTQRVWMKSAMVERELGNLKEERRLLMEGINRFPSFHKLYLMLGQLEERQGNVPGAQAAYNAGLGRCPTSVPLCKSIALTYEKAGAIAKARSKLEQGRQKNPRSEQLWLEAIRMELRASRPKFANELLAKALQACPSSGILNAEAIAMAPRPQRKSKSAEALTRCNDDPHIIAAVAQLFWNDRKVDKARSWFSRAVLLDPDNGDFWALFYQFEQEQLQQVPPRSTAEAVAAVLAKAIAAEPRHGERWQAVSKALDSAHESTHQILMKVVANLKTQPIAQTAPLDTSAA